MIAVIDCGTNTFNLIVVEPKGKTGFNFLYNDKIPVKMGEGGIQHNLISPAAFQRGIQAMVTHKQTLKVYPIKKILAVGTAALRDAENGQDFVDECHRKTGIKIQLIDGNREAELIYKAANTCIQAEGIFLVMDIGGGSNEFIIADRKNIYWKKSYRLGVSMLKEKYKSQDYPDSDTVTEATAYIRHTLADLFEACKTYNVHQLIGTAGSFDTYANVFSIKDTGQEFDYSKKYYRFDTPRLIEWCKTVPLMNHEERNAVKGIPAFRKEFMAWSCMLTYTVLEQTGIKESFLSTYSLKEGVILEYLEGKF